MSAELEMVVGLEVHAQLATSTKLFCACAASSFGAPPNSAVCPVCTGQPGALPALNARAVELALSAALALDCRPREKSIFARKNYFYPDLPKGYQISQYEEPLAEHGAVEINGPRKIGILRVHMEEDAGKLLHGEGSETLDHSRVDFNRSGVPLIEIVSEADLRSPDEAYQYLAQLKAVLQYAGVSRCDMEKGEMRCDANVSMRPKGAQALGTKIEIKNLNSFKAVRDALAYERARQGRVLAEGGTLAQETRLWSAERGVTEPMRSKEEAHDYRYFPEPDLVPLLVGAALVEKARRSLPELPAARRARLMEQYGLSDYDAGVLTAEQAAADYFEAAVKACGAGLAKQAANWMQSELFARLNAEGRPLAECPVAPRLLGELVALISEGALSGRLAKEVFAKMWETRQPPKDIVERLGLAQVTDSKAVGRWVAEALAENPKAAADVKAGKERAVGALVGAVMKKSKGKANPDLVNRLIKEKLS
ncbi:MAG: Asp-tRNA(Asn)/Glu-tRNA(Gln) amidotransferase subunit GatB [Elusimicrobia bacterium]|nr:Asp-tRNA(Asn)/Glu-tRNA(Gln) amidotransferase subunit GatB [Elusimicrobiota bacterium]